MTDIQRLNKLLNHLQRFINQLEKLHVLTIHQTINQSYYMQKVAELQLLYDRLNDLFEKEKATCDLIAVVTPGLIENWRRDIRWLQKYSIEELGCPIL